MRTHALSYTGRETTRACVRYMIDHIHVCISLALCVCACVCRLFRAAVRHEARARAAFLRFRVIDADPLPRFGRPAGRAYRLCHYYTLFTQRGRRRQRQSSCDHLMILLRGGNIYDLLCSRGVLSSHLRGDALNSETTFLYFRMCVCVHAPLCGVRTYVNDDVSE